MITMTGQSTKGPQDGQQPPGAGRKAWNRVSLSEGASPVHTSLQASRLRKKKAAFCWARLSAWGTLV